MEYPTPGFAHSLREATDGVRNGHELARQAAAWVYVGEEFLEGMLFKLAPTEMNVDDIRGVFEDLQEVRKELDRTVLRVISVAAEMAELM